MNIVNRNTTVWKGKATTPVQFQCVNKKSHPVGPVRKVIRTFATFDLTHDHECLRKTCKEFADKELRPSASEIDREKR